MSGKVSAHPEPINSCSIFTCNPLQLLLLSWAQWFFLSYPLAVARHQGKDPTSAFGLRDFVSVGVSRGDGGLRAVTQQQNNSYNETHDEQTILAESLLGCCGCDCHDGLGSSCVSLRQRGRTPGGQTPRGSRSGDQQSDLLRCQCSQLLLQVCQLQMRKVRLRYLQMR